MSAAQAREPPDTVQYPLLDFKVNPLPELAAVKVAHVPVVYHFPLLIMQPFVEPPVTAFRVPLPEKVPVAVGEEPPDVVDVGVEVVVVVDEEPPPLPPPLLGRYLTPVLGQPPSSLLSGLAGTNWPVATDPYVLK